MVKENFEKLENTSKNQFLKTKSFRLAEPIDRLAAFIVDMGIIFLICTLILAPVQRRMQEAQFINDFHGIIFNIFLSWIIVFLLLVIYWTFFTFHSGTTIGKRIFQIKVVSLWPQHTLSLWDAVVRSIVHFFELCFIGIFHFSIFSDPRRRLLHDRLSNTIVVSTSYRKSNYPKRIEAICANLLFVFIFIVFLGSITFKIYKGTEYIGLNQDEVKNCDIIEDASKDWPNKEKTRLSVALGLYAAGVIGEECLQRETYHSFRNEEEMPNAYLAKAFLNSHHTELSNLYIQYICQRYEESESCKFTQIMDLWVGEKWEGAKEQLQHILPDASAHVKIWSIKYFKKIKDYNGVLELIEELWPAKYLSEFLGSQRIIALYGVERENESETVFQSIFEYLDNKERYELASWLCYNQLNRSCANLEKSSCSLIQKEKRYFNSEISHLHFLLDIKLDSCLGYEKSYKNLISKSLSPSLKSYISSLVFEKEGKINQAKKKLKSLIKEEPENSIISHGAKIKFLDLITESDELEKYQKEWMRSWSIISWDWKTVGQKLMKKLNEKGLHELSLKLGKFLFKKDSHHQSINQELVVAYCNSQKSQSCHHFFKNHLRGPASKSEEYKKLLLRIGTSEE